MEKLKNNEARPKFTGSYKKNAWYALCILFQEVNPIFSNFIKYLESKHDVERYIAEKNNQIEEYRKRWDCVYKYFHYHSQAHKYKLFCNSSFFSFFYNVFYIVAV